MNRIFSVSIASFVILCAFVWGVGVGKYKWFPFELVKKVKYVLINSPVLDIDDYGRTISYGSKVEVECPTQNEGVGVLLAFGQSNSANHAEYRYKTDELVGVYNYFDGKCYAASSPLLGASGENGEWISKTARNLISNQTYKKVVVVSSGIGGTALIRWAPGSGLNTMLQGVIKSAVEKYQVTDVVWHQGEADRQHTSSSTYTEMFMSVKKTLREGGIKAPIFVSVASICGDEYIYPNRISLAQSALADIDGIERGVNTDELVTTEMRYDKCHFGKSGQELASAELAKIISTYHR